ncbi:hypothetical protein H2198_000095 [Neophaeococcomyces mojaviensis]|uniref:Uncharacterized protein n=1 Tax=Neophaeococcomyces mojaviensis TaxID=3383035 RepID=A0ACC3AKY3_9EURO|nr:hypothetical protein H2198_000095 [Knufia sp. JES_112]
MEKQAWATPVMSATQGSGVNTSIDWAAQEKRTIGLPHSSSQTLQPSELPITYGSQDALAKETEVEGAEGEDTVGPLPPSTAHATRPHLDTRGTTNCSVAKSLPPLKRKETRMMQKQAHPMEHLGITLGLPMILLFDIVIPCIIYYTWYNSHKHSWERTCREDYTSHGEVCPLEKPQFDKDILGYAIISFGFGELWILVARVWRLYFRQEDCAPLLSRNRWELDATSWVYGVAMILALIPFVVGSSLVQPHLYLYSPTCLMGFLGLLMVVTTVYPFKIPIGINSQARGSRLRPFIYYAAEDFIAVDGLQDREFRIRYNERYETNKAFRRMFYYLTLWWLLGVCVYVGAVSAVIWTCEFHIAFGLSLGVLFSYIAVWAAVSYVWVRIEIAREHRAFEKEQYDG